MVEKGLLYDPSLKYYDFKGRVFSQPGLTTNESYRVL
jgi:hypothetical protein